MVDNRRSPGIIGTAIAIAAVGAIALGVYSVGALPGFGPTANATLDAPGSALSSPTAAESLAGDGSPNGSETGIPSAAFPATVNYVHDGDTLYLDDGNSELKVRLIGIDTPELDSAQRPDAGECYGEEARQLLRDFLPEGTHVWATEDREPQDRYGRSLLYVHLEDGTFVNLAMIELGAAEALKVGLNDRYWPELREAQSEASAAQLGMWGRC